MFKPTMFKPTVFISTVFISTSPSSSASNFSIKFAQCCFSDRVFPVSAEFRRNDLVTIEFARFA